MTRSFTCVAGRRAGYCARRRVAAVAWYALAALAALGGRGVAPGHIVSAAEVRFTTDFADVAKATERYAERYGPEHVLLVVDIDNTLLAMNHDLGSDQWFIWQEFLIKHEPASPNRVADTFEGLLEVQGLLYNLGRMHPPQPDLPALVGRIQGRGVATVVLTSRGDEFRVATERELTRNGYDFARSALPVRDPRGGTYLPYDLEHPDQAGFTAAEVESFDLKPAKPVSYSNGIMMSSGQHKAAMLLSLLHRSDRDIQAIVYADDHGRHVAGMFSGLVGRQIEAAVFHYQREDVRVQAFEYGDKNDITRRWHQLRDTLDAVFEKR